MYAIIIAHRSPAAGADLAARVQAITGGPPGKILIDPEELSAVLPNRPDCTLIIDINMLSAVLDQVRFRSGLTVGVTNVTPDPRAAKLEQWGIPLITSSQVNDFLSGRSVPATGSQITTVHSPKGGTGTSTVAAHLAAAWARNRQTVLLLDITPYSAAPIIFQVTHYKAGLEALVSAIEREPHFLDQPDVNIEQFAFRLPSPGGELYLIAGGRPRVVDRLSPEHIAALFARLRAGPYDQIVVDTSAEPTPRNLAAAVNADRIALLATADHACQWNLLLWQEILAVANPTARPAIIINQAGATSGNLTLDVQNRLKWPVAATISLDPLVSRLGNGGVPWDLPHNSPFMAGIKELADALSGSASSLTPWVI